MCTQCTLSTHTISPSRVHTQTFTPTHNLTDSKGQARQQWIEAGINTSIFFLKKNLIDIWLLAQ